MNYDKVLAINNRPHNYCLITNIPNLESALHSTGQAPLRLYQLTKPSTESPIYASTMRTRYLSFLLLLNLCFFLATTSSAFQSDELLADDEEFGLEGGRSPEPSITTRPTSTQQPTRKRSFDSGSDLDSKTQFQLEHAFGDSDFSPAGTFSARLKTSAHGGQVF